VRGVQITKRETILKREKKGNGNQERNDRTAEKHRNRKQERKVGKNLQLQSQPPRKTGK
jgi:hypothetical protein